MRGVVLRRRIHRFGFFWSPRRLYSYERYLSGNLRVGGFGGWSRRWVGSLLDGVARRWGCWGGVTRKGTTVPRMTGQVMVMGSGVTARKQNVGLVLWPWVRQQSNVFSGHVWNLVRYLYLRHYRGRRYRLGLPAHGQHTHSNAQTTRHVRSRIRFRLCRRFWFRRIWAARRTVNPQLLLKRKTGGQSRRGLKAERHKRGVVRTRDLKRKQKKSVWR